MSLLSPFELRTLTFRAASLLERRAMLEGRPLPPADRGERLGALLRTWMQAYAPGRADALEARLAWDGLTLDNLEAVVADPADLPDDLPPAAWTTWLSDALDHATSVARDISTHLAGLPERALFPDTDHPPFLDVLAPFARAACARLASTTPAWTGIAPAVRDALCRQLLRELATVSELSWLARFHAWRDGAAGGDGEPYHAFVRAQLRGGLLDYGLAYPVAARHLATIAGTWCTATAELLTRLDADRDALDARAGALGACVDVTPALSDPHDGRRRVAILTFASGTRVVYKPRDVRLDAAWSAWVDWARDAGLAPAPPSLWTLVRDGYGWAEYAATAPFASRDAIERYYGAAGALIALAWMVRARDLQMENVVATASGPVVIDAEMCAPPTRDVDVDEHGRPRVESILTSGLVTTAHVGPAEAAFDIGGLRGDGVTPTALGRRHWHGLDTAALAVETSRVITAPTANRVLFDGALQDPRDYQATLLDGFERAYRFLLAHRDALAAADGPLRGLYEARSRVLFRPSQHYGSVQYALAAPAYQTSGALRSCALDTLNRVFNLDDVRPSLWPVIAAERQALDALDLPRFTVPVDGTAVRADSGPVDVAYFVRSGLDGVRAVVRQLSEDDLATQRAQLREVLADGVGARLEVPLQGPPEEAARDAAWLTGEAAALADELTRRADRGERGWRWTRFDAMPEGWARHVCYDGSLGTAVFFAGLARVTGDRTFAVQAASIAADARALADAAPLHAVPTIGIGGCSGAGALVYGFTLLASLTNDDAALAAARRVAAGLTAPVAATATTFDVTGGAAGAVLALLALDAVDTGAGWAEQARAFGDRLLDTAVPTGLAAAGWPARRGRPIAGFAHGSAGIALALARLAVTTGDARYHEAALRACAHERALFAPSLGNWPVVGALDPATGSGHSVMTAWCHGAAGIALSRVAMPAAATSPDLARDADLALAATTAAPISALDQVCCGNLGRADILLTASRTPGRAALGGEARALVRRIADRASRRQVYGLRASGVDHRVADPGFFRGLAGIGYTLLRAAAPGLLPSVLAFETTSPVRPSA